MRNPQFVRKRESRLQVQKTYKLFIGGKFVRGENGRVLPARGSDRAVLANYCRASRKDFRDAVTAARNALLLFVHARTDQSLASVLPLLEKGIRIE